VFKEAAMRHLVEFPLQDGGTILVQVDEPVPEGGIVKAASAGEVLEKAEQSFEDALDRIKPAAATIISRLRGLSDPPDEIEVEFGLTLNAKAGAFIAAAGAEANYTVKLTWKREAKA
jgi:hypothetical protein